MKSWYHFEVHFLDKEGCSDKERIQLPAESQDAAVKEVKERFADNDCRVFQIFSLGRSHKLLLED